MVRFDYGAGESDSNGDSDSDADKSDAVDGKDKLSKAAASSRHLSAPVLKPDDGSAALLNELGSSPNAKGCYLASHVLQMNEDDDDDDDDDALAAASTTATAVKATPSSQSESSGPLKDLVTEDDYRRWLYSPCGVKDKPLLCHLMRDRGGLNRLTPTYHLFVEIPKADSSQSKTGYPQTSGVRLYLLSAKKKVSSRTSYYHIVRDDSHTHTQQSSFSQPVVGTSESAKEPGGMGKVRGNTVGSKYSIIGSAGSCVNPVSSSSSTTGRCEMGIVQFEYCHSGPSKIESYIPLVNTNGKTEVWAAGDEIAPIDNASTKGDLSRLIKLVNVQPRWDDAHGGHVLNFHGRVTVSSVKNFQLRVAPVESAKVPASSLPEDSDSVVLQFGKTGKNDFSMDVRWPLSPFQAFSICTACIDGKLADRSGYALYKNYLGGK